MMKTLKISVIIPTYCREQALIDSIEDVLKQNYSDFEILVIDQTQNHELATEKYLQELAESQKISWYRVNWASLPGARNYAVRRAKGDLLIFVDDDVNLPENYLKAHSKNYQEHPEIGAVAGRVFDRMKLADYANTNDDNSPYTIEYLPPEAMDAGIAWYYIDLVHTTKPQQVISARGCNMSFRRDIFIKHNIWFDERFRGSAVREESDFCLRLRRTNYQIWYDPEAHLIHLGEETGGCHDIDIRSFKYQFTFYHNHFLMALKNLTLEQQLRLYLKLFDCHVLGHPPCNKSGSPIKIATRLVFYILGFFDALITQIKGLFSNGQIYSQSDLSSLSE
jgi:GT2 family glycosyltransferase